MTEFEFDQRLAQLREETASLEAPQHLITVVIAGVRERGTRAPEVFRAPRPWLVPMSGVVMIVAIGAVLGPSLIREKKSVMTASEDVPGVVARAPAPVIAQAPAVTMPAGVLEMPVAPVAPASKDPSPSGIALVPERPIEVGCAGEEAVALEAFQFAGLESHRGHVVVLVLFSDWSASDELRDIERAATLHAHDTPFIGVFDGDERTLRTSTHAFAFPVIVDPDQAIHSKYPHTLAPTVIAIDAHGRIFEQSVADLSGNDRRARIDAAIRFAEKPPCRARIEPTRKGTCGLRGLVQRKADGRRVDHATVAFELIATQPELPFTVHATTDRGAFVMPEVPCGRYRGQIKAPNLSMETVEVNAESAMATLSPIFVSSLGQVSGIVVAAVGAGAPVANAFVSQCDGWPLDAPTTETGDDGRFVLTGLRAGSNQLLVRMPYAHGGTVVDVGEGETASIRVEGATSHILGSVRGDGSNLVVRVTQQKVTPCAQTTMTVVPVKNRQFGLRLAPGAYMLQAESLTTAWQSEAISVVAEPGRMRTKLELH